MHRVKQHLIEDGNKPTLFLGLMYQLNSKKKITVFACALNVKKDS